MVHWPKSTVGRVMTIVIALIVGLGLVQSAIALSGTFVWITLAVAVWPCSSPSWSIAGPKRRAISRWPTPRRSRTCCLSGTIARI